MVVELFTSQGCNSCPPADALLGDLATQPGVIALAFHVDYWDSLGWRDPYALPESSKRQRAYALAQRSSSVFTPQMMLNGRTSVIGGQRNVLAALQVARDMLLIPVKAQVAAGQLTVALEPRTDKSRFQRHVVAYLPEAATTVERGENAGHTLKEYNIVRGLRMLGVWDEKQNKFSLPLSALPGDASQLAVLVQDAELGTIVGATKVALH